MKSKRPFYLGLCAGMLVLSCAAGEPDFTKVDACIQQWIDAGNYPGAGLWIVDREGHTLHERYWNGYDRDTFVMMASATKWIEAATMMTLVDSGKLDLDAPVSTYLPELTGPQGRNTLRQMFSHTSSLNTVGIDEQQGASTFPAQLASGTAKVEPRAEFEYGGTALAVGWDVVERVSGLPWHTYYAQHIANPLDMHGIVTGHDLWIYEHMNGFEMFPRANASAYMNFLLMMLNDGEFKGQHVLSREAVREMQADQVGAAVVEPKEDYPAVTLGEKHHGIYGLGEWRLVEDAKGNAVVLSSPSFAGFIPWIDKRHGIAAVFVGRTTGGGFDAFHESAKLVKLTDEALSAGN